jgi:hypothetical protein
MEQQLPDEEHYCHYVSSHGIQKSCSIILKEPAEVFRVDYKNLADSTLVYIKPEIISIFKMVVKNILQKPIILVSGDSDVTVPNDCFSSTADFLEFIENPLILHWYAQNCVSNHPKMTKIPIGLDYHTMRQPNNLGWGNIQGPRNQERGLVHMKQLAKPFWERIPLCYSNFHFFTSTRYGYDRKNAILEIPAVLVFYEPQKTIRIDSWRQQINYAFVICPLGNGFDTHRLYEALCLGCIPIVKRGYFEEIYQDLPVLVVDEWRNITQTLLNDTIFAFESREFNYQKLTLNYWVSRMKQTPKP